MFILLPVVILVSSASTICLLSYCKSRNLKKQESQVNHVTRRRLGARQPVPSIYIVPTTSQIMEMYANQAINNAGQSRTITINEQFKPPPDYGQVVVEIPPTYEEAININREGRSIIANQT